MYTQTTDQVGINSWLANWLNYNNEVMLYPTDFDNLDISYNVHIYLFIFWENIMLITEQLAVLRMKLI